MQHGSGASDWACFTQRGTHETVSDVRMVRAADWAWSGRGESGSWRLRRVCDLFGDVCEDLAKLVGRWGR